uniref:MORN repeat-containing protein 5 n=3 Tax=Cacopsylla melanoneura TaxID=428564 RepID=A0A8D8Z5Z7_9HEMI
MSDGFFHGAGVLRYQSGAALHGVWNEGRLIKINKYIYKDGFTRSLEETDNFDYCGDDDRRFHWETQAGVGPGRKVQLTNDNAPRYIPGKYYDVVDGFLDLSIQWVLDRNTLEPIRHATADEIHTSMKHCRKGWHEYTGYKGPLYRDPTDTLSVRKAYKAVPGLNSDKKQLKLERKLEILKYKINHEIATDQDIILYCAIMRGRVTRSMLSSEPVSVEEEEEPSGPSSVCFESDGAQMPISPLPSWMNPSFSQLNLPPSEAEGLGGSCDYSDWSTVTLNIPLARPPTTDCDGCPYKSELLKTDLF